MIGIVITAVILVLIIIGFFFGKETVIKRKLRKVPRKPIAAFNNGELGKLVGNVEFYDNPLIAPLSGRRCAYYHVVVKEYRRRGKSGSWVTIVDKFQSTPFILREGEHYALVPAENLHAVLEKDGKFTSGTFNDASPQLQNFLQSHGLKSTGLFGLNRKLRYLEGIFEENESVAVLGHGYWEAEGSTTLIMKPGKDPIYVSDVPNTKK
jgi:hypothetical protein